MQIICGIIGSLISIIICVTSSSTVKHYETFVALGFNVIVIGIGIFYFKTYKERPVKKNENNLMIMFFALMVVCLSQIYRLRVLDITIIIDTIVFLIGIPFKQGYKGLPYKNKK